MIDLHFWPTPNCYKVSILLEELELSCNVKPVHIGKGEQFTPEYEAINPSGKDRTWPISKISSGGMPPCARVRPFRVVSPS